VSSQPQRGGTAVLAASAATPVRAVHAPVCRRSQSHARP
jgi:hypothetical protein